MLSVVETDPEPGEREPGGEGPAHSHAQAENSLQVVDSHVQVENSHVQVENSFVQVNYKLIAI